MVTVDEMCVGFVPQRGTIDVVFILKRLQEDYHACSLRVKANSVLCLQCGRWLYGRCAGVKRVTPKFQRNFACTKCEGNIVEAVGHEENLFNEVETVMECT